jgi:DNA-binding transcriptional LysR family regulator
MSDKLRSMQVFVMAATAGSFAAAAERLDMSPVMVGKHVQALERQLGARLIERTTRKQTLTEIGKSYLERCRDVLESVDAADHVAEAMRALPQGVLRVSAPVTYGIQRLMPVLAEYAKQFPQVKVDLALNDRLVDLADEGIDVAIRTGSVDGANLIAKPLQRLRVLAAASPDYLKRCGVPRHPADLAQHNCLAFAGWGPEPVWRFARGDDVVPVPVHGSFVCNNGPALLIAAMSGLGVVVQSDALLEPYLRSGHLTAVLPEWEIPSRSLHIVRRPEIRPSAKIRSFVDFVLQHLG